MGLEQDLRLVVVWVLLASSIAHSTIHMITWWALGEDSDDDTFGRAIRQREASLGAKAITRILFDVILIMLVLGDYDDIPAWFRIAAYIPVSIASVAAILYGIRFINVLRTENWGRPPETKDARDRRQDQTQEILDETSLVLAKRGELLSKAGASLDRKIIKMGKATRDRGEP